MFGLYLKMTNFHWHVSGPHFRDYHLLLDEQGEQIFATTDAIAERVAIKAGGRGRVETPPGSCPQGRGFASVALPHRNEIPLMRSAHFLWRSCHVQCYSQRGFIWGGGRAARRDCSHSL